VSDLKITAKIVSLASGTTVKPNLFEHVVKAILSQSLLILNFFYF